MSAAVRDTSSTLSLLRSFKFVSLLVKISVAIALASLVFKWGSLGEIVFSSSVSSLDCPVVPLTVSGFHDNGDSSKQDLNLSESPRATRIPCNVSMEPRFVSLSATESIRVGGQFEIRFLRILSAGVDCSMEDLKPRDVLEANVRLVNETTSKPDIVTHASVEFIKMVVVNATAQEFAAEYAIQGRIFDAGNHSVVLLQMYFLENDDVDLVAMHEKTATDELRSVRFLTGFNPFKYGPRQWGLWGLWHEAWTVTVSDEDPSSLDECSAKDAFVGRWVRIAQDDGYWGGGFEWRPHGCQLITNFTRLQGKRLVLAGASIMRCTFEALCKLLYGTPWCHRDTSTTQGGDKVMIAHNDGRNQTVSLTYFAPRYVDCGPWEGLSQLPSPDIMIGTCGSHVIRSAISEPVKRLGELHSTMVAGTTWPGRSKNFTWMWMTTNAWNPAMDVSSWSTKVLIAPPRFAAMHDLHKAVVGVDSMIDWYRMTKPITAYTFDQVHFPLWAYNSLARVLAHVLCKR